MKERSPQNEIIIESPIRAMAFSPKGDSLVSGGDKGVWVWRVEDGKQLATMTVRYAQCLAVSQDGRWIGAGTYTGEIIVWDAATYETVFLHKEARVSEIRAIDFAPHHATRIVTAEALHEAVSVWNFSTRERVLGPLRHEHSVIAAKYSPQGDRIATATHDRDSVRVYDSDDGHLLAEIPLKVCPWYNTGLSWSKSHLLNVSASAIKEVDSQSRSTIYEWSAPGNDRFSCLVLSHHGEFIAYSTSYTIKFWDTSTHAQLGIIQHAHSIRSIALSPDDRLLAVAGDGGKITTECLPDILPPSYFSIPFIDIATAALESWKEDQLADAEESLTKTITGTSNSGNASHHALANRALVRARMRLWDVAIEDARSSIKVQPSAIGYIAQSVALIGGENKTEGLLLYDFAFKHCHPSGVDLLLLIKAIVLFLAGEHHEATLRIDTLIASVRPDTACYVVQAYMHLLLGNLHVENKDYERAIESLEHARVQLCDFSSRVLLTVTLVSGWKFDNIGIKVRQLLCDAQYTAGRTIEAGNVAMEMLNTYREDIYKSEAITNWVADFMQRWLAAQSATSKGDVLSATVRDNEVATPRSCLVSPTSQLLREWARVTLMKTSWEDALTAAVHFLVPRFSVYRVLCERLETVDHLMDATNCFHKMVAELGTKMNLLEEDWVHDFKYRCCEKLEGTGDIAAEQQRYNVAIANYSAALTLDPTGQQGILVKRSRARLSLGSWKDALDDAIQVLALSSSWSDGMILTEWTKANLTNGLWKGALSATRDFKVTRPRIYQVLCEGLEVVGGNPDAIECFHQMVSELGEQAIIKSEQGEWFHDFRYRCSESMEHLGDAAMDNEQQDEALRYYSAAVSIHPANTQGFFVLRSKVCMAKRSWEDAILEAELAIALDPSSPWGYEIKRAALHQAERYDEAVQAFETMLTKMAQSPDPKIRDRRNQYCNSMTTRAIIRRVVQRIIRHTPRVLINTTTGCLQNKAEQVNTFMSLPIVHELVSSMTTCIDRDRIKHEVRCFFRYVVLSHKWEENEPLFQQVIHTAVYDLDPSSTHQKLQAFCRIVRDAGFHWAWSDTCCINKEDHFVLQEALVAMFRWYRDSAMMIVFLRGVRSPVKMGDLAKSVWNTRAWTLQEYVAARVIQFYTEDWTPYFNLNLFNHKESLEAISEMEQATGVSVQQLMDLRPGLSSIREKLRLASSRQTTLLEDAAYSLLGIFSVAGLSAIYGEGEKALGRLLAHILSGSGDTSILAWTGQSGGYNSCLPARINVFTRAATSHLPAPIEDNKMEETVSLLQVSNLDLDVALRLYDRLNNLPVPWFAANRMKLPCIALKLPPLSPLRTGSGRLYRVETVLFGTVEVRTRQDLSRFSTLYLAHPWLDALLDREHHVAQSGAVVEDSEDEAELPSPDEDDDMSDDAFGDQLACGYPSWQGLDDGSISDENEDEILPPSERDPSPRPVHVETVPMDRETRALRMVARLRQPFGALLFTLASTRRRAVAYRRVAADSIITVQAPDDVSLTDLLDNVRVLDIL